MRTHIISGILLLLLCLCPPGNAQTPDRVQSRPAATQNGGKDDSEYRQLVERVKRGDMDVDFVRLRTSFGEWLCNENVQTEAPNREAMVTAFNENDYAKAVALAEVVLDYEFVQLGVHRASADAYRKLENKARADFHQAVAEKLLNALLTSGNGKTAETAYRVLTIREEYFIMNELGFKVTSQALMSANGKAYDVLSGRDSKTDKSVSVYFDISSFFGGCKKSKK